MMFVYLLSTLLSSVFCVINVDILVHSHCDPGWLETTDMYFDEFVNPIITNNIDYLMSHPEAKYNFVEAIYLNMWWEQASDFQKKDLLYLIHETKQWEIQMGGWVMNDQACPTYSSSIDQLTHGHQFVKKNLGVKPVEGFTLDPFGQTPTQAYLYSLAGFNYTAQWRIPYTEMNSFEKDQTLEFWWQDDNDLANPLFTHILDLGYYGPSGFNFFQNDAKNDPPITSSNVKDRASALVDILDEQVGYFKSKENLLMMWGGDFAITHPSWQFGNTSLLINYINNDETYSKTYKLRYTTATEYFSAVSEELKDEVPTKKNKDFFVYDDNEYAYWSGYFVSQPRMKLKAREGERTSRVAEMVYSSSYIMDQMNNFSYYSSLEYDGFLNHIKQLRDKNGQVLHHDAITGTEKWHVSDFYISELDDAMGLADEVTRDLFSYLASPTWSDDFGKMAIVLPSLYKWQVGYGDHVGFFLYNSLGWAVEGEAQTFTFGTAGDVKEGTYDVKITNLDGSQVFACSILRHDSREMTVTIVFDAGEVPAVGFQYYVMEFTKKQARVKKAKYYDSIISNYTMSNDIYTISFDPSTNKMSKITTPSFSMSLSLDFEYYTSFSSGSETSEANDDPKTTQNSGAYVFRPISDDTTIVTSKPTLKISENDVFVEARQRFDEYIDIGIRLYKTKTSNSSKNGNDFFEIVYYKVGVIPPDHEVVVTLQSDIGNEQTMYHDELALDMKKKEFEEKEDPGITAAAMHFPMQYAAYIEDGANQLTIVSTKSGNVASMNNGKLEVMIHRSTSADDSRGVNQPLLDKYVIREEDEFRMRVSIDDSSMDADSFRHLHSYRANFPMKLYPLHPDFWNQKNSSCYPDDFRESYTMLSSSNPLIEGVTHLLSMNKIDEGEDVGFVLRVNHLMGKSEEGAKKETLELSDLFSNVQSVKERLLTLLDSDEDYGRSKSSDFTIELKPIQIKTYDVKF